MIPSTDPNTIRMKCASLANKKNIPTWRWIKDDVIDLSVDEASDDETKDRIEITDDGMICIHFISPCIVCSWVHVCVVETRTLSRGTLSRCRLVARLISIGLACCRVMSRATMQNRDNTARKRALWLAT